MALLLPLDAAELVGYIMQTLLFGVYLVLLAASLYCLSARKRLLSATDGLNWAMLTFALLLSGCISLQWAFNTVSTYEAFVSTASDRPGSATFFFQTDNRPMRNGSMVVVLLSIWVYDAFLVYRVFTIWRRNFLANAVPALSLLACIFTTGGAIYELTHIHLLQDEYVAGAARWVGAAFSLSLFTHLSSSCLIAYGLVKIERFLRALGPGWSFLPIVTILVESAALTSLVMVLVLLTYLAKSTLTVVAMDILCPTLGIAYSLIIIRVSLKLSRSSLGLPEEPSKYETATSISDWQFVSPAVVVTRPSIDLDSVIASEKDVDTADPSTIDGDERGHRSSLTAVSLRLSRFSGESAGPDRSIRA